MSIASREPIPPQPDALARKISDRHFGVGSDGLILICKSQQADARMRMFNADGSESEMCGNGIRCVAKYVYDHGICRKETLRIETGMRRPLPQAGSCRRTGASASASTWASRSCKRSLIPTTLPGGLGGRCRSERLRFERRRPDADA